MGIELHLFMSKNVIFRELDVQETSMEGSTTTHAQLMVRRNVSRALLKNPSEEARMYSSWPDIPMPRMWNSAAGQNRTDQLPLHTRDQPVMKSSSKLRFISTMMDEKHVKKLNNINILYILNTVKLLNFIDYYS